MKIELENIKHDWRRTQETPHFSADLHVDGSKIGIIYNEGTGGDCSFLGDQEAYRATEKWASANLKTDDDLAMDLDTFCFGIVFDLQARDELRAALKTAVLVNSSSGTHIDAWRFPKAKSIQPRHIELIRRDVGPNAKILNEMPFEEAFGIFQASAERSPSAEPHAHRP